MTQLISKRIYTFNCLGWNKMPVYITINKMSERNTLTRLSTFDSGKKKNNLKHLHTEKV